MVAFPVVQRFVELFGGLGDRARDAARGLVPGDGECRAFAAHPRLDQGVREVGKGPGSTGRVAQHELSESGFEPQAGATGGLLDRVAKRFATHGGDEVHAVGHARSELVERGAPVEEVGSHHEDDGDAGDGCLGDRCRRGVRVHAARMEDLLELVDHQHGATRDALEGVANARLEVAGRQQDHDAVPAPTQDRDDAGEHERGLPAPGRPRHREERGPRQPGERGPDVGVAPEEVLLVLGGERPEPGIRTVRARGRHGHRLPQRRIVPEHRQLERLQLLAGLNGELLVEPLPRGAHRRERITLTVASVERRCEHRPAAFAQRSRVHHLLGDRHGFRVPSGSQPGVETHLLDVHAGLLEARRLRGRRQPAGELRERDAVPQPQRTVGRVDAANGVAGGEVLAGRSGELLEPSRVDRLHVDMQPVSLVDGLDGGPPECLPHEADRGLHLLLPGVRPAVAPDRRRDLVS